VSCVHRPAADELQDLLYLSPLKMARLSAASGKRRHVSALEGKVLGNGLRVELAASEKVFAQLPTVLNYVYNRVGVRTADDPDLTGGHWVAGVVPEMAYGQGRWDFCREDDDQVFFTGLDTGTKVLLGGSLAHMLDRDVPIQAGRTGSTSERLREVLTKYVAVEERGTTGPAPRAFANRFSMVELEESTFDSYFCIDLELAERVGRSPMRYLASVIDVFHNSNTGQRLVLGTPLFVARMQPFLQSPHLPVTSPGEQRNRRSLASRFAAWTGRRFGSVESQEQPNLALPAARGPARPDRTTAASPRPLQPGMPSMDLTLYVIPSAVAQYEAVSHYYEANPAARVPTAGEAPGDYDFLTEQVHWLDDTGGTWLVSFSHHPTEPSDVVATQGSGCLLATRITPSGPAQVLVLREGVNFTELANSLRNYRQAPPRLSWVVTRV
jgi:hypothetical protein